MQKMMSTTLLALFLLTGLFAGTVFASNLDDLFTAVGKLNIQRHGYTLGKALNKTQLKTAASNPVEAASKETFKFQDKKVFIVAENKTNRVLVIYEQFEDSVQKKIQNLVGDLYMTFDDPTVLAHDKVVYWAYTKTGKVPADQFDLAKEIKKPLDILATVKFVSDIKIMEKEASETKGQAYYIISSDPILKQIADLKELY